MRNCRHHLRLRALRDVERLEQLAGLPFPVDRRARHVVTENARVLEAVSGVSVERFGELMNASHESLRDDFEVSVAELDILVRLLQDHSHVYGARLTGAGFGGACVALAYAGEADRVKAEILEAYAAAGFAGRALV